MASSSQANEFATPKSEASQKKTKVVKVKSKKTRNGQNPKGKDDPILDVVEGGASGNAHNDTVSLLQKDEADSFTNLYEHEASLQAVSQDGQCTTEKPHTPTKDTKRSGYCSWLWGCLPKWMTEPVLYYQRPVNLEDPVDQILQEIPKTRLLTIWEIFSAMDTDNDNQVHETDMRLFFYHLAAASADAACRARVVAAFSSSSPPLTAEDLLDALAKEPKESRKACGWVRTFGSAAVKKSEGRESQGGTVLPEQEQKDGMEDTLDSTPKALVFWQFATHSLCQRPESDSQDFDLVEAYALEALRQRWGRFRHWKLAKGFELFRKYNETWQPFGQNGNHRNYIYQ